MENEPSFLLESLENQNVDANSNSVGFSNDVEDLFKGECTGCSEQLTVSVQLAVCYLSSVMFFEGIGLELGVTLTLRRTRNEKGIRTLVQSKSYWYTGILVGYSGISTSDFEAKIRSSVL